MNCIPDRRKLRGFTLVELVLVATLLAILAALAVPRFSNTLTRTRVEAAARRFTADLELARQRARSTSAAQVVTIDTASATYVLVGMPDPDHRATEYTVHLGEPPYEVAMTSLECTGGNKLTFDGFGVADSDLKLVVQAGDCAVRVSFDSDTAEAGITTPLPGASAAQAKAQVAGSAKGAGD